VTSPDHARTGGGGGGGAGAGLELALDGYRAPTAMDGVAAPGGFSAAGGGARAPPPVHTLQSQLSFNPEAFRRSLLGPTATRPDTPMDAPPGMQGASAGESGAEAADDRGAAPGDVRIDVVDRPASRAVPEPPVDVHERDKGAPGIRWGATAPRTTSASNVELGLQAASGASHSGALGGTLSAAHVTHHPQQRSRAASLERTCCGRTFEPIPVDHPLVLTLLLLFLAALIAAIVGFSI
jgi:hypothetical protein